MRFRYFPLLTLLWLEIQRKEFGPYVEYLTAPPREKPTLSSGETPNTMSYYFLHEDALFRSYLPGHLRKRSTFRDQLVVLSLLRALVMNSCHDLPASGGHLACKATYDKIRDRFWGPTMAKYVTEHIRHCVSCQHRKTSHRSPKLPVGHRPVSRPFQCLAIDLIEYKASAEGYHYVMSVIDLTRFVILVPLKDKCLSYGI